MSTLKNNITAHRFALLAKKNTMIFHTGDLANIWGIKSPNTLRVTLKRYVRSGLLYRIFRGFYSLRPESELDPVLMGARALHRFCYVSAETVLYLGGYRSQIVRAVTLMSDKSIRFTIGDQHYRSHQLSKKYLYQTEGIMAKDGVYWANQERAIADMLYLNPRTHFDRTVDWGRIKTLQRKIGYPLTPERYDDTAKP